MSTINDWPAVGERIKFDRATSQICPLCHVFIAKGHSWAKRLPRPMVPRSTPDHMQSVDTAGFYYKAHPQPIKHPDLPRWFVHAYCWPKYLMLLDFAASKVALEEPSFWEAPPVEVPTDDDWKSTPPINFGEYMAQTATPVTCSEDGCERGVHAKGLCRNHHHAAWRASRKESTDA